MCDNLPNINADQLTRAVAGTLSALDAPEDDEVVADENGLKMSKKKEIEKKPQKEKNGEGSKSSIQLLECLSASIDPKFSKLQELNEAHMAYTPSTSFYGRARKVSTKKKSSEDAIPKAQSKKFSSRKNYKLLPPHLPDHVQTEARKVNSHVLLQPHLVKLSPDTKTQQSLPHLRPLSLPMGSSEVKQPVFVIQTSQVVPLLSTASQIVGNSSGGSATIETSSGSANTNLVSSDARHFAGLNVLNISSSSPQTLSGSLSTNFALSPSPQIGIARPSSCASTSDVTKCLNQNLVPVPQINSVIRLPVPLTLSPPQIGSNNSLQMARLAPGVNPSPCSNQSGPLSTNSPCSSGERIEKVPKESVHEPIFDTPAVTGSFQCEGTAAESSDSSTKSKGSPITTSSLDVNKNTVASTCVNDILMKSVMSPNHAHTLNISATLSDLNNTLCVNASKGYCGSRPINPSVLFSSSETHKSVKSINQSQTNVMSKIIPVVASQQVIPRMSTVNSLKAISPASCGPILVWPNQSIRLPLKLTNANQVVLSIQPPSVCSAATRPLSASVSTSIAASNQMSIARPALESKVTTQTPVFASNRGLESHPNILKLLQTTSSAGNVQNKMGNVMQMASTNMNSINVNISPVTSTASVTKCPASTCESNGILKTKSSTMPPPKTTINQIELNGSLVVSKEEFHSAHCFPNASSSPQTPHLSSLSTEVNAVTSPASIVTSLHTLPLQVKSASITRMQLTVVTDPFSSKQSLQTGAAKLPMQVKPHGVPQLQERSLSGNPQLPHSCTTVLSPSSHSTSPLSEINKSLTASCFTAPISTPTSHKAKKETVPVKSVILQSKSPFLHQTSPQESLSPVITSGNEMSSKPGIQIPPISTLSHPTSVPALRFTPRSSALGGAIPVPTLGSRLIISPAGISQLQSLMRKQGMSEGYFVISAKRAATTSSVQRESDIKRPYLAQSLPSVMSTSSQPELSHPARSVGMPMPTPSHFDQPSPVSAGLAASSFMTASTAENSVSKEMIVSCPSTSQTVMSSIPSSYPLNEHQISSSSDKKAQLEPCIKDKKGGNEGNEFQTSDVDDSEESDDDSVSSSDSTSSSVALVIETNYDSDHKRPNDDTPSSVALEECKKGNEEKQMEKETPLNLSKDMISTPETSHKSDSPDSVNDVDQNQKENDSRSLSHSPHEALPLLDSMRGSSICVPQSPLSLTEIIRQQQYKFGLGYPPIPSPHFTAPNKDTLPSVHGITGDKSHISSGSYASSDIPFSISDNCSSSYSLLSHHTMTDHQAVYDRSLNTPHSFYPHDNEGDCHVHDSSDLEAAMNLQRLRECPPPMSRQQMDDSALPSSSVSANVTSPKSPLSLSSMHPMENSGNINPPMTPNTMLINLLNRVPTPLLTNHQDLLTNPASQENGIQLEENEQPPMCPSSSKGDGHQILEKSFVNQKSSETVLSQQIVSREAMFGASSPKIIPSNSDVFAHPQNALDLIASNYLPRSKEEMINPPNEPLISYSRSALTENLVSSSKSCQQDLFADCGSASMTLTNQEYCLRNFSSSLPSTTNQSCYHATSCPVPLTVTVNLDCDSFTDSSSTAATQHPVSASTSGYIQEPSMEQESLTNNFTLTSGNGHEKCGEAEILRHLIQNTNTSCPSHPLSHQPIGLQFDSNTALFTPHIPESQFETEMPSSFMQLNQPPATMHKSLPCRESLFDVTSLNQNISFSMPPDSSMETYTNLDNETQSLRYSGHSTYENVPINSQTELQSNSFNNGTSIASYEDNPDASFEPGASATFEPNSNPDFASSQRDPSYQTESSSGFIMSNSLSDIQTSFEGNLEKDNAAIHSKFMDSNPKLHLSDFRESGEQSEIFFGQTNPPQNQTQPNDLIYDMSSIHPSNHDIAYQMPTLQDHQQPMDNHQGVVPQVHDSSLSQTIMDHHHDIQSHHTKDLQGHNFDFQGQASHQFPDSTAPSFSDHQGDMGFIQDPSFPHFYNSVVPTMPLFTQHCAVGSEAPMMMSISNLNCPMPPYSAASDLQFRYHAEEVTGEGEKHPVLPSASFSPPSVADQAATPDSGNMNLYNGSFQNLTVYDMYVRGGNTESRSQMDENPTESGNFCVECNTMYKTQCKFHPSDCVHVSDMPIPSHARLTLPACLKLALSSVHGHISTMGVFAKEKLSMRIKFGPLIGSLVSCDKLGSTRSFSLWQIFSGKNVRVIDTSDENSSNWLMFLKPARVSAQQNLVAFQQGNSIYFITRCEIEEGQELMYWFSKDYARMLGMTAKPKNAQHQLCPHCHVCKQVFADRKQVRSHIRVQHPKPHINKCSHCSRRFSQVSHLNAHVLAVHLRLKKFMCNHCGKRFNDSSNLRKHVKSHSEERNFKCQMCGKAFRQKAHLQIHMNTHMPVKHEQCGFCGERFTRAFERKQHELQHTKQHKIECQHCSKVFYKQKVYKEHLKIHRNERNFPCGYCGKAFRNKFALTRHGPACKQRKRTLTMAPSSSEPLSAMHASSATQ